MDNAEEIVEMEGKMTEKQFYLLQFVAQLAIDQLTTNHRDYTDLCKALAEAEREHFEIISANVQSS